MSAQGQLASWRSTAMLWPQPDRSAKADIHTKVSNYQAHPDACQQQKSIKVQGCIDIVSPNARREPWNKGKLTGAKQPLWPKYVWSIRAKLQTAESATWRRSI